MNSGDLTGVVPILQMPFNESGGIELDDLRSEVTWLLEQGVNGIGFGYASEIRRMTDQEIDQVVSVAVQTVAGEVPVIPSIASGSEAAMCSRAATMARLGADAVLVPPPYRAGNSEGVIAAFDCLARSSDLPIVLQDAPVQTGVVLPVTAIEAISRFDGVIGLKLEAPPTVPKIEAVANCVSSDIRIFGGAGGQDFFFELLSGADGTMPGAAFPGPFLKIVHAFRRGDLDDARRLFASILPLVAMSRRNSDTLCYTHKVMMRRKGIITATALRGPHAALPESLDRDIEHCLHIAELGLGEPL